jgi:hypothetical protein
MKKALKVIIVIITSLLVFIIALAFIIPVAFKEKIKTKVEEAINSKVNANVSFADYKLSLIRTFPNITFYMRELSITGHGQFESDTIAAVKSFGLVFNTLSIFGNNGYEIRSIVINRPLLNAIVLEDGTANWDIMKESPEIVAEDTMKTFHVPSIQMQLRKFALNDGKLSYNNREAYMAASVSDLDLSMSGKMAGTRTMIDLDLSATGVDFIMDNTSYVTDASIGFRADVDALLDSMKFTLKDNLFRLNDIEIGLSGTAAMPGDDIIFNMVFSTPETSFKSLLSMVPALYLKDFEGLNATGAFSLDGSVRGIYSSTDSILPDIEVRLNVSDGVISYPDLPEKITAINIKGEVNTGGNDLDNTTVDVSTFHFELAGNPFDMTFMLATPVSDPSLAATARGKIDLSKLQKALPLDSLSLNGLIDVGLDIDGRMSMLEAKKYDQFSASGSLTLADMTIEMPNMPAVDISEAAFSFTPAYAELNNLDMTMGEKSDVSLTGKLENYIPYFFSDGIIKGSLALRSNEIDLNEILGIMPADTIKNDTTALSVIRVPDNIDFNFSAAVGKLAFNRLIANDVRGSVSIKDGVVTISNTGMKVLGGSLQVDASYDTRDTLNPEVEANVKINAIGIRDAFNTFNTVQKLMPMASGLGGSVSLQMDYKSMLGQNIMPMISTISGTGELRSESIQILESKSFDQMKGLLKIDSSYTNTMKNLKATFIVNDGRIFIKPFDTRLGNIKLNVAGDQGLDQTLNYLIKTEIPKSDLGPAAGALMGTLTAQAASFGLNIPVPDIIKVNLKVSGTFKKPVITPVFAGGTGSSAAAPVMEVIKEEVTSRVSEAARQEADKILMEAEEKAERLREEAASAAAKIREEADSRGKKLVADADSKGAIALLAAKKAAEALSREADKRASQLESEANAKADKILVDARTKADELLK